MSNTIAGMSVETFATYMAGEPLQTWQSELLRKLSSEYEDAQRTPYATPQHFIPIPEQPADRPSRTVYCIASSQDMAEAVARRIAVGRLPDLYLFACDCLAAWRGQPAYMPARYLPWRVDVWMEATGVSRVSTRRLEWAKRS